MKRTWVSLLFLAILSLPAAAAPHTDPAALVREFYERHPRELQGGLPRGQDLQWLSGWISAGLEARFRGALAYQDAWIRRNDTGHGDLKPPFADGVDFTGVPDVIDGFEVRDAEPAGQGEWHVPVRFCITAAPAWEARVVVSEERHRCHRRHRLLPPAPRQPRLDPLRGPRLARRRVTAARRRSGLSS